MGQLSAVLGSKLLTLPLAGLDTLVVDTPDWRYLGIRSRRPLPWWLQELKDADEEWWRLQRLAFSEVLRAGREALAETAEAHGFDGWARVLGPRPCPDCEELAARGVSPWSEPIEGHPLCQCAARPVYLGRTPPREDNN